MSSRRYTEEFMVKAAKQVIERGSPVAEVASRLGVTAYSMYPRIKRYSIAEPE